MTDTPQIKRRDILAGLSTVGVIGLAGCTGGNESDEGDGGSVNENNTDTPTESNEEDSTNTPTEAGYDPQDYYGLPECDGSRPIQLIAVNSDGTGIIQNMRGQDQLVYVKHDDGLTSGDYCGGTIVGGGEQTAYEVTYGGEPRQIEIGAVEASNRNKDKACSQSGALPDGDYTDGCVDPNSFRGYQDVSSESDGEEQTSNISNVTSTLFTSGDPISTEDDRVLSEDDPVYVHVRAEISDSREPDSSRSRTEKAVFSIQSPSTTYEEEVESTVSVGYTAILKNTFAIEDWEHDEAESLYSDSDISVEYENESFTAKDVSVDSIDYDYELRPKSAEFSDIKAVYYEVYSEVEFEAGVTNNLDEEQEISYTYTVDGPEELFEYEDSITVSGQSKEWVSHKLQTPEWENVENSEELFEKSSVYIDYNGQMFEANKYVY